MISHAFVNSSVRNFARLHAYGSVVRNVVFRVFCNDDIAHIERTLAYATAPDGVEGVPYVPDDAAPLENLALTAAHDLRCILGVGASKSNGDLQLCDCIQVFASEVQSVVSNV
jgi:hypothetical protein